MTPTGPETPGMPEPEPGEPAMTEPLTPESDLTSDEETDAMLMALADGELEPGDAAPLLARVAANPALSERFALFVQTRALTRAACDPGPVPDRLVQAILAAPADAAPAAGASVVAFRPRLRAAPAVAGLAMAATLVLAVGLGAMLGGGGPAVDPALRAAEATAAVGTGGTADFAGGSARVLGSYATDAGLCRTLEVDAADGRRETAIVCRDGAAGWTVALSVTLGGEAEFVTASDSAAATVDGYLDSIGAGLPLEPADEAAALR